MTPRVRPPRALIVAALALVVAALSPPAAAALERDPLRAADAALRATVAGDRLTLAADATPWSAVVDTLAERTGIALRIAPLPQGTVTTSIVDVEIKHALRLLFGADASFVFLYGAPATATDAAPLEEVWVTFRREGPVTIARPAGRTRPAVIAAARTPVQAVPEATPAETRDDDDAESPKPTLDHHDPLVRIDAIVDRGDGTGVEEIRQVLLGDQDHEVRGRAVTALGRIGTPEALEALRPGLADPEVTVRLGAVEAVAGFENARARALIQDALRDKDEQVRSVAAEALRALRSAGH
jgi:hypothetical protein